MMTNNLIRLVIVALFSALLLTCANNLKGKNPYWYNGYVYGTQGYSLFTQGRLETAVSSYRKALAEAQRLDIPAQAAQYMFNIGRCIFEMGENDSALVYFGTAHDYFVFCRDSAARRQCEGYMALAFSNIGKSDSAMVWYKRATSVAADKNEKGFWLSVHGILLWRRDHGKEALNYLDEADDFYRKQKAYNETARMCRYRAEINCFFSEYGDAKKNIGEALLLSDKSKLHYDRFRNVLTAAKISACLNDTAAAQWYYQRARKSAPDGMIIPLIEQVLDCNSSDFNFICLF